MKLTRRHLVETYSAPTAARRAALAKQIAAEVRRLIKPEIAKMRSLVTGQVVKSVILEAARQDGLTNGR